MMNPLTVLKIHHLLEKKPAKDGGFLSKELGDWVYDFVEESNDLICLCRDGAISYINNSGINILNLESANSVIGCNFADFISSESKRVFSEALKNSSIMPETSQLKLICARGKLIDVEVSFLKIRKNKNSQVVVIQARDITNKRWASYDQLTELPNRALFFDRLDQEISGMCRKKNKLGLLFIDMDNFKLINDTYGHAIGDLLLVNTAKRICQCIRSGDTAARLGGDEFTVIIPNLQTPDHMPILAQRILETIEKTFFIENLEISISCSIGVTIFPDDTQKASDLIKKADTAMYMAKQVGKSNFQFFSSRVNKKVYD